MNTLRRLLLGLGAALAVGGWGLTQYAEEQQQSMPVPAERTRMWVEGGKHIWPDQLAEFSGSSREIYGAGIISMAIGAGLVGIAGPRVKRRRP